MDYATDGMPHDDSLSPPLLASQTTRCARVKVINDPVHGHFELCDPTLSLVDTPPVQRLRDLKQLGTNYLVFPGASHNRFEHSLGVAHLSSAFVTRLRDNPRDPHAGRQYENATHYHRARALVEMAGLCHDLGHGPYSHLFDHGFLPAVEGMHTHPMRLHEARSVMMLEHLVDEYHVDLEREDVRLVAQLITGCRGGDAGGLAPAFLYDVVANAKNGIDTDKFDYVARDVYNLGLQTAYGFDHGRLINFAKVVDDDICFHRKEVFNVYNLFLTRFQLHRSVYNHRASLSIGAMISDVFLEADRTLKISESINDPFEFMRLTDSIVPMIEYSSDQALARARQLIRRVRTRKLYRFVDEILLPPGRERTVTPQDITTCQDTSIGIMLNPEDIHVAHVGLHFGMKSKNPVDEVLFFADWEDETAEHISTTQASYVMPAMFEEKILRVFVKREQDGDEARLKKAVTTAFRKFIRQAGLGF